tara:strand:- start:6321 stop:7202 length:882 start_codon:yes stop_codon:yes gene_type:complete
MSNSSHHSYQPYSNKPGLCIIESKEGSSFLGIRIESASFPTSISAIQAGIVQCLMYDQQPAVIFYDDPKLSNLEYWIKSLSLKGEQVSEQELNEKATKLQEYNQQKLDSSTLNLSQISNPNQTTGLTSVKPIPLEVFGLSKHSKDLQSIEEKTNKSHPIFSKIQMEQFKQALVDLCKLAICPESNFPVGALLWTNLGVFPGVNVEFHDWSLGLCAERTALISALSHGADTFFGIFVHAIYGDFSTPCGACRQILSEHMLFSKLYCLHKDYTWSEYFIHDLLPNAFHTDFLAKY